MVDRKGGGPWGVPGSCHDRGVKDAGLPSAPTPFVGRVADVEATARLLARPDVRLVTLTGPAGVGKTRLAIEVARRNAAVFGDGALFVPLADVRDPPGVSHAVLGAVGAAVGARRNALDALADVLADREMLLVLDNMEQVIAAALDVAALLDACPRLTVLATSRRPLAIRAEHCVHVEPMAVPKAPSTTAEHALRNDAVALLVSRLEAVDSRFTLSDSDVPIVVGICSRLDGLPLALELAAARARSLPLGALLAALESRLPVLTGGPRDQPARQRTMSDAVGWSYELLDAQTAALFRRLGVCIGGATLDAAAAVAADLELSTVALLDAVDQLVAHSLLQRADGDARYRMLEVVREYAIEQLARAGEEPQARRRHATHFLVVAEEAAGKITGPEQAASIERLAAESPNLTAAVRWAVEDGDAALALRLCLALRMLWYVRGPLAEGRSLFAAALAVPGAPATLRARALVEASTLARHYGDFDAAHALADEGLLIARAAGDADLLAAALLQQGFVLHLLGQYASARTALEESLAIRQRMGDQLGIARASHHLGLVAAFGEGDIALAWEMQVRCLALFRELGNQRHAATALIAMADLARARGELRRARELLCEALRHVTDLDDTPLLVYALHHAASLAADESQQGRAVRLLGAAEGLERSSGAAPWPAVAAASARWLPAVVRRLGPRRVAALRAAGARLSAADAAALAQSDQDEGDDRLTRREHEIAELVAVGMTNRLIAERLFLSERTVDGHVARILDKLEFATRAQIAAWVAGGEKSGEGEKTGTQYG